MMLTENPHQCSQCVTTRHNQYRAAYRAARCQPVAAAASPLLISSPRTRDQRCGPIIKQDIARASQHAVDTSSSSSILFLILLIPLLFLVLRSHERQKTRNSARLVGQSGSKIEALMATSVLG